MLQLFVLVAPLLNKALAVSIACDVEVRVQTFVLGLELLNLIQALVRLTLRTDEVVSHVREIFL